jgi:excisionase family DNA binding protein
MSDLLTSADAARILGVVPATVRQLEKGGKLPAQRTPGGVRLFRRSDVERLARERASQVEDKRSATVKTES